MEETMIEDVDAIKCYENITKREVKRNILCRYIMYCITRDSRWTYEFQQKFAPAA